MKIIMSIFAMLAIGFAAEAKTVTVKGELARTLIDVSNAWGGTEGAAGSIYAQLLRIKCTKTVNDKGALYEIHCLATPPAGKTVSVSSYDTANNQAASQLRRILIEVLGPDVKTSEYTRNLVVKSLKCQAMQIGHEFDDLDLNPPASCTITQ